MILFEMVLCRVTWPNQEDFRRFTVDNKKGLLLSSKEIHLLSHAFDRFVFGVGNAEESPEVFNFQCLYAPLCLCRQSCLIVCLRRVGLFSPKNVSFHCDFF